jgi:hypothetical protein
MSATLGEEVPTVLIIVSREHEGLYQGLKSRQEANGQDRVLLDRRNGERRRPGDSRWQSERRNGSRRLPLSDAERALMNVLGFTVLHRELQVVPELQMAPGERRPEKPAARPRPKRAPARPARSARRRVAS